MFLRIEVLITFLGIFSQCKGEPSNCASLKLSMTMEVHSRMVEVVWETEKVEKGDWIAVYDGGVPTWLSNQTGLYSFQVDTNSGRKITPLSVGDNPMALDITARQALNNYSACYWRKKDTLDEAITTTRFYTFPNWQKHYWTAIKNKPLTDIFIPGTAHSACFNTRNPYSIINQLAMGIRYFDIRISMHNHKLYAAYSDCCQTLLDDVISDLVYFIDKSGGEVVILDITKIKEGSSSKFSDNGVQSLQNEPNVFDKIINFVTTGKWSMFTSTPDASKKADSPKITFDDFLLGYLNGTLRLHGKPTWIEKEENDDGQSIYKKSIEEISGKGSVIIISYPNNYTGQYEKMIWSSYLTTFDWDIKDLTEYFLRENAFPENKMPTQLFKVVDGSDKNLDKTSDTENGTKLENGALQCNQSSITFRDWGIDSTYNLSVNILFGQYFRNIGNVRTAFVWNERLTSGTGKCDSGPSPDSATWYYQHSIV